MERELENSPDVVPRESDTPTEVLARAVEHHALRADNATELVELFEEARFSPHVMTEDHREAAVRVLQSGPRRTPERRMTNKKLVAAGLCLVIGVQVLAMLMR